MYFMVIWCLNITYNTTTHTGMNDILLDIHRTGWNASSLFVHLPFALELYD